MRNKERIATANNLCQNMTLARQGNTLVRNYCHFLDGVRNGKSNKMVSFASAISL
jgi:hypothetical protein